MDIELPERLEGVRKEVLKWLNTPTMDEEKEYLKQFGIHWFEDEELFEDWMKKKLEEAIVKAITWTRAEYFCLLAFAESYDLWRVKEKIEEVEKDRERIDREFDKPSEAIIEVLWDLYDEFYETYERKFKKADEEECKPKLRLLCCSCLCSKFEYVDGEADSLCNDWRLLKCANCGRLWKFKFECTQDGHLEIHLMEESLNDLQGGNSA